MIEQLDQILKDILSDIPNDNKTPKELNVSFDIPKEKYAPSQDTVNLYLYDIHENRNLRDPVPVVKIVDGKYQKRKPPLRVDCSYMLTAWSGRGGDTASADEHKILSRALIWLSLFPEIPKKYLPDDWKDNSNAAYQPFPVYLSVAQQDGVKQPGEFWAALGSPPRPFLNVVVTITMDIPRKAEDLGPPIISRKIRTGQKQKVKEALQPGTEEEGEYNK